MELFAQEVKDIQGWIQIVTSGGFGALVWYLVAVALPKMQDRFDQHAARQQKQYLESLDKQMEYLQTRDAQSKEIAQTGHAALSDVSQAVNTMAAKVDNLAAKVQS